MLAQGAFAAAHYVWIGIVLITNWIGWAGLRAVWRGSGRQANEVLAAAALLGVGLGVAVFLRDSGVSRGWAWLALSCEIPVVWGMIIYWRRGALRTQFRELILEQTRYGRIVPANARVDAAKFSVEEFPVVCPKCGYMLRTEIEVCSECGCVFDRGRLIVVQWVIECGRRLREGAQRSRKIERAFVWSCCIPIGISVPLAVIIKSNPRSALAEMLLRLWQQFGVVLILPGLIVLLFMLIEVVKHVIAYRKNRGKAMRVLNEIRSGSELD